MSQQHLWYDTPEDAISDAIKDSGKSFKEIACELWPSLKMETAYARLKACLNTDKDEKLSFAEIILICKRTGRFDPIFYACDECSLHRPTPKAHADEHAEILNAIQRQQAQLLQTMQRLERMNLRVAA